MKLAGSKNIIGEAFSWNVEKILLLQIYNNKWIALRKSKGYEEAIVMYEKAIELNPKYSDAFYNKWNTLYNLGRYKKGALYEFSWNFISGEDTLYDILYRKEKNIIREYIKNKNFEWLRIYLLGLEDN
jgi:tetratricopeptide (TPR) repeat protein